MIPLYASGCHYRLPDGSIGSFDRHGLFGSCFYIISPKEKAGVIVPVENVGDSAVETHD